MVVIREVAIWLVLFLHKYVNYTICSIEILDKRKFIKLHTTIFHYRSSVDEASTVISSLPYNSVAGDDKQLRYE